MHLLCNIPAPLSIVYGAPSLNQSRRTGRFSSGTLSIGGITSLCSSGLTRPFSNHRTSMEVHGFPRQEAIYILQFAFVDASSTTLQSGPTMNASIYRSERRAPARITPSRRAIISYVTVANTNVTKTVHLQGITLGWLDSWSRTKLRSPSDDPKGSVEQQGQVPDWSGGVIYNNNIQLVESRSNAYRVLRILGTV